MARTVVGQKDAGMLAVVGATVADVEFRQCVLSMTGAPTRSRFESCRFEDIVVVDCVVGHAIFHNCGFENVEATDTVTLFAARFVECSFAGSLSFFNFGSCEPRSMFFSPERQAEDRAVMEAASFCLDISRVSRLHECSFIGDSIARKIRFRRGQGLLLKGKALDKALHPLLQSTNDMEFAALLATAVAFGEPYDLHFCPVPVGAEDRIAGYAAIIREQGVEVLEEPVC